MLRDGLKGDKKKDITTYVWFHSFKKKICCFAHRKCMHKWNLNIKLINVHSSTAAFFLSQTHISMALSATSCIAKHKFSVKMCTITYISQLGLVHSRPRRNLVVFLIAPQGVHLQLIKVHLWQIGVGLIAVFFRILSASLRSGALDSTLVKVTDVDMLRLRIESKHKLETNFH